MVKLVIMSPVDSSHMKELEGNLRQFQDLRLIMIGGSTKEGEGAQIVVSIEKPTPLINALKQMPLVEEAVEKGKEIQITLKSDTA
jgi:DNA polymerase/3'-5' exonuclease PolX